MRTYAEHLAAWEEMDRLGYDGVGFNEHHTSPYGLMNSPNLLAAAAAQRTERLKLLIYGNLLPLHDPLRLAEELAMLDCLSNGRIDLRLRARHPARVQRLRGAAAPSRARASRRPGRSSTAPGPRRSSPTRAGSGRTRTWRSGRGRSSSRTRRSGCRSPAARRRSSGRRATTSRSRRGWAPAAAARGHHPLLRRCLGRRHGHRLTPDHLIIQASAYVADSKAQAVREAGPYTALLQPDAVQPRQHHRDGASQREAGYLSSASFDYVRPENLAGVAARASGLPRHDDGGRRAARASTAVGAGRGRDRAASSPRPTTRAPTRCCSA